MENNFIDREALSAILLKYLQRILSVRYGEERKSIFENVLQQKVLLEHLRMEKRKTDGEESEFKAF
jgi:hypothetical protein